MLLVDIGLAVGTPRSAVAAGGPIRDKLIEWARYSEMPAIRRLSDLLNAQPLKANEAADSALRASPPFELPDKLPSTENEGWRFLVDALDKTKAIVSRVGDVVSGLGSVFEEDDDRRGFIASLKH